MLDSLSNKTGLSLYLTHLIGENGHRAVLISVSREIEATKYAKQTS